MQRAAQTAGPLSLSIGSDARRGSTEVTPSDRGHHSPNDRPGVLRPENRPLYPAFLPRFPLRCDVLSVPSDTHQQLC